MSEAMRGVPDPIHHTDTRESLEYITGWNDCRAAMLAEQPVQRTWVGLTSEEVRAIFQKMFDTQANWPAFAEAIEAKLKEKNT